MSHLGMRGSNLSDSSENESSDDNAASGPPPSKRQLSMFPHSGESFEIQDEASSDSQDEFSHMPNINEFPTTSKNNFTNNMVQYSEEPNVKGNTAQKIMERMGYKAGRGLGKHDQGRVDPVEMSKQRGRRGLGLHIPGLEAATLVWKSDLEVITHEEHVHWLEDEEHSSLAAEQMEDWIVEGKPKLVIDDETNFCDSNILRNVISGKNVFDQLDPHEMMKARTRSNPFETIRGGIFLNRAAMKMANMDKVFDFMFTKPVDEIGESLVAPGELLYFADVCAGPGGFSEYVLWRCGWQAKGFGFTLRAQNDFKLSNFYAGHCETFETHYGVGGSEGDGDVFKQENINCFSEHVISQTNGQGVHFMMADGGFSVEVLGSSRERKNCTFYLGMGRNKVYRFEEGRWRKVVELIELSPDTLFYGEIVQELHGEGRSQRKIPILHIIDAIFLGGKDISKLHITERLKLCRKFCQALNKSTRTDLMPIRTKQLFDLEYIDQIFDRLKMRSVKNAGPSIPECAICLQMCVHPAQLPCGHIFCFLCVKGVANQSKKCAMCRQEIPTDYLEKPQLLEQSNVEKVAGEFDDGYQWFYEGRNGWWQYEERTSADIEEVFKLGEPSCEIMICGVLYIIDFVKNHQYRKHDPTKKRRIKRDLETCENKGIAGIRWWQYDERTSRELETAYKKGERLCELLIAGFLYIADFDAMLQLRRNDPSRRRRIKRDLSTIPKKGIAGLRLEDSEASGEHNEENQSKMSGEESQGNSDGATTPIPPTNTPQTPASNATSGTTTPDRQQDTFHRAVVEQFRSMWRPDDLIMSDSTSSSEDDDSSDDQHDSNDQLIDISNEDHELPDVSRLGC
uniref:Cap-specific mRNA (nucleoside-2'-O-)-methyltransferase 1 n=1 Tax=Timema genevievae TaxID=629358 RepID=A0A7R9JTC3_TIMGE|nr:unnamed protein product [Timema genevievae]